MWFLTWFRSECHRNICQMAYRQISSHSPSASPESVGPNPWLMKRVGRVLSTLYLMPLVFECYFEYILRQPPRLDQDGRLQRWSSLYAPLSRFSHQPATVTLNMFLAIVAYWASHKKCWCRFLPFAVAILSSVMYSSYCTIATMVWVSASLLIAATQKLSGVTVSSPDTLTISEGGSKFHGGMSLAGSESLKRWWGSGGWQGSWATWNISWGCVNVSVVGEFARASVLSDLASCSSQEISGSGFWRNGEYRCALWQSECWSRLGFDRFEGVSRLR